MPGEELSAVTEELPNHITLTLQEEGCLMFEVLPDEPLEPDVVSAEVRKFGRGELLQIFSLPAEFGTVPPPHASLI